MSYFKVRYVALFLGAACLIGAFFAPWLDLTSAVFGLPPAQEFSPSAIIWGAIFNMPTIVRPPFLVVMCILYLGAALAIAILAIPIVRGAEQRSYGISRLAGALMAGAVECGLFGLFAWLALPFMLAFFAPYPDSSVDLGIVLALAGSALAIVGLTAFAVTARERALSHA
jgi:hypothetical protein